MSAIGIAVSGAAAGGAHALASRNCMMVNGETYCQVVHPLAMQKIDPLAITTYSDVNVAPYVGLVLVALALIAGLFGGVLALAEEARAR